MRQRPALPSRPPRRHAAADENLRPGHTCRVEELRGYRAHAAGRVHRGERQGVARTMLPAWRGEPAKFFFGEDFPAGSPVMQADDHCVEFAPIKALKQVGRGSDPNFDQQLRVLRVHTRYQGGQLRPRNMIAEADGEALPALVKNGKRAIVYLKEFAGMLEEGGATRRNLYVPGCPLDEPAAKPLLKPLQLQAHRGLRHPHSFRRAREAAELGNADESLDGIQVEGGVKPGQNGRGP
jgi:hypothetical protein